MVRMDYTVGYKLLAVDRGRVAWDLERGGR